MVSARREWLLLFDIDGTLLRTNGAGRESTRRALLEVYGTDGNMVDFHFGGRTDWQIVLDILVESGLDEAGIVARLPDYQTSITRHLQEIIAGFPVEACPSAVEVVQTLRFRPDVGLGLVTGNVGATAPVKLQAAGFDPAWFPVGAFGHEAQIRAALPPLAMQRAAAHYGAPFAPERVIVIGDTPADVECARTAGALAVAVDTGFEDRAHLEAAQPDVLLDDLSGFLAAFETLAASQR
ncbi:MAG TPA: HAD hydrolase-like protein [Candidatus Limnocylindrales bacterium]|nr:HAD hydrolase-like protein [Candidatus Limnocylindrales bacterium]